MTLSARQAAAKWGSLSAAGISAWSTPDPVETLKQRYVMGVDTLEEFEQRLEETLRAKDGFDFRP